MRTQENGRLIICHAELIRPSAVSPLVVACFAADCLFLVLEFDLFIGVLLLRKIATPVNYNSSMELRFEGVAWLVVIFCL